MNNTVTRYGHLGTEHRVMKEFVPTRDTPRGFVTKTMLEAPPKPHAESPASMLTRQFVSELGEQADYRVARLAVRYILAAYLAGAALTQAPKRIRGR